MRAGSFLVSSAMLGVGLAADAFSVSVVNGIRSPHMRLSRAVIIAGTFAFFQFLMPMAGWFLTHSLMEHFKLFRRLLPWISQFFLLYLGLRMILDGNPEADPDRDPPRLTAGGLLVQAVATSIDALLVVFTIASYSFPLAALCSLIVAAVTFGLCLPGVHWGKRLGLRLADKASLLSGVVLILIAAQHFFQILG